MKTCCFIGHRNVQKTPELYSRLVNVIKTLIEKKGVLTFYLGNASDFNQLCYEAVTEIKKEHPTIKRVYVRSHFAYITEHYTNYLLKFYDDTFIPDKVEFAGKASYVERNQEMINLSDYCVFYYNEQYQPPLRKQSRHSLFCQPNSGTKLAYEYAIKKNKKIINLYNDD